MKLEQQQKQTLSQTLKMQIFYGYVFAFLTVLSIGLILSDPIKNFIRSYRPLPTAELHHH